MQLNDAVEVYRTFCPRLSSPVSLHPPSTPQPGRRSLVYEILRRSRTLVKTKKSLEALAAFPDRFKIWIPGAVYRGLVATAAMPSL